VVRFKCEAHVFINFGPNNSLEIVFTQPLPVAAVGRSCINWQMVNILFQLWFRLDSVSV
jgi:hypothetical protein